MFNTTVKLKNCGILALGRGLTSTSGFESAVPAQELHHISEIIVDSLAMPSSIRSSGMDENPRRQ